MRRSRPEPRPTAIWLEPRRPPVASTDTGDIIKLGPTSQLLVRLLGRALGRAPREPGAPSAITLATIAEAAHARPAPWSLPPDGPRASDHNAMPLPPGTGSRTALSALLEARHSARRFGPLAVAELADVLRPVTELREVGLNVDGSAWARRAAPSAGGRHPIDLYVLSEDVDGLPAGLWRVEPDTAELVAEPAPPPELTAAVAAARPSPSPATIAALADFRRTTSRYPAGSAHVWRDAGVLLGILHLRCTDLGLNSRILGLGGQLGTVSRSDVAWVGGVAVGGASAPVG